MARFNVHCLISLWRSALDALRPPFLRGHIDSSPAKLGPCLMGQGRGAQPFRRNWHDRIKAHQMSARYT